MVVGVYVNSIGDSTLVLGQAVLLVSPSAVVVVQLNIESST